MTKQYKQPEEVKAESAILNPVRYLDRMVGLIETVDAVPTGKPINMLNQVKIYKNGSTYRFYWYDIKNDEWRYATGT